MRIIILNIDHGSFLTKYMLDTKKEKREKERKYY